MAESDELEDWKDLVSSKGWGRLDGHLRSELEGQFAEKVSNVVKAGGDVEHIRQVVAIRDYVLTEVLGHPRRRIEAIEQGENTRTNTMPTGHRRGKHL